jgi:hypothetical protein
MENLSPQKQLDDATRGFVTMNALTRRIGIVKHAGQRRKLFWDFVAAYSQVLSNIEHHPEHADGVIRIKTKAVQEKNSVVLRACERVEGAYNRRPTEFRAGLGSR